MNHYQRQDRGDQAAYSAYFAGMDASMQQKVALTTAYFPAAGRNGPAEVLLDLPDDDGVAEGSPEQCSSAALFELFVAQFRSSQNREGGVSYQRLDAPRPGWARFRVALRAAAEFLLRKDYRADWATELIEEYNPWMIQNRWMGQAQLLNLAQQRMDFPPTNLLIAGEKMPHGAGCAWRRCATNGSSSHSSCACADVLRPMGRSMNWPNALGRRSI